MRTPIYRLITCMILLSGIVSSVQAEKPDIASFRSATGGLMFSYDRNSAEPIIEYRTHIHMLAEPQLEPDLQVFADGRVIVHRPVYMKDAGVYELQMTTDEVNALIIELDSKRLVQLDHAAFADRVVAARTDRARKTGKFHHVSDDVTTTIDIRLKNYRPGAGAAMTSNVHRSISLKNIRHEAQLHRDSQEIQDVATGVTTLRNLMKQGIDRGARRVRP